MIAKAIMTVDLGAKSSVTVERIALMKKLQHGEANLGGRNRESVEGVILDILKDAWLKVPYVSCVGTQPPAGYVDWHNWAEAQYKAGIRQTRCPQCQLWNFPQEMSAVKYTISATTTKWGNTKVTVTGNICNKCAANDPNPATGERKSMSVNKNSRTDSQRRSRLAPATC